MSTGLHLVPIEQLIREAESLLQSPVLEEYPYERAMLYYCVGSAHVLGDGDIRRAIWSCQNAHLFAKQLHDIWLQAYALFLSTLGLIFVGEFSLAHETLAKLERLVERSVHPDLHALRWMVHASLANYQGDLETAKEMGQKLQHDIEEHGFTFLTPWVFEVTGMLTLAQGKYAEAEAISLSYLSAASAISNTLFKGLALRFRGMAFFYQGKFAEAREVLAESLRVFSKEAYSKYEFYRIKPTLALVHLELKDYGGAERELDEALQYFLSISSHMSLAMTHFVASLVKWEQGKKEEASLHLQTGLRIAEEKKYDYFYFLGPEVLVRVCLLAFELKDEEAARYATPLLTGRLASRAEGELRKLMAHPDPWVREKLAEIRKTIHRSKAPPLRIETLGGFRVFRGDSPMDEKEWDRNQPKQLLKLIVSHGMQPIPKDVLSDDLWPDEDAEAAEKNFKTALTRLRKSIEPAIDKEFGSSYVHMHGNLISLDPGACHVDAEVFLSLSRKGEEKEKKGDAKAALALFSEAADAYKGDFLPEDFYAPRIDSKREVLKGKYIEVTNKIARLYESRGSVKKAIASYKKAIEADPLLEESYRNLMLLYSGKGLLNEALRAYEDCKRALKNGLKTKPDPVTVALYNKIRDKLPA
jgi:DNA-binding SARP family transcriptional activator